jgi:RNA polymerase sigma-70 factor (ECF subfamily)
MIKPSLARGEDKPSPSFEDAYEKHYNMIYQVCFSYLKNAADTEDLVADVFEKLLIKKAVFQSIEHEKAWLLRTAINKCKDQLKHWWRKRANLEDYKNLVVADTPQESDMIRVILDMPVRYKDVIYLYYYIGYKTNEIAKILKRPESTIRNHLREARIYLKGVLDNEE